jgi:hypothetical protein
MFALRLLLLLPLVVGTVTGQQKSPQQPTAHQSVPPASCPVTVPPAKPFTPAPQYQLDNNEKAFWFGTEKLWAGLRKSGTWEWSPHKPGHERDVQPLTEKTFWGSVHFNWAKEWRPKLKVTGRRLDKSAPPLLTLPTTNAFPGPAAAMLVGVYVPTPGCWQITGEYWGQKLSYVVWVKPIR